MNLLVKFIMLHQLVGEWNKGGDDITGNLVNLRKHMIF